MEQSTFQSGDPCFQCQQHGLSHRLRIFYVDIEEQIVKCESDSCLYPYENDLSDSDVEHEDVRVVKSSSHTYPPPRLESFSCLNNELDDTESVRFLEALLRSEEHAVDKAVDREIALENPPSVALPSNNDSNVAESVSFIEALLSDDTTGACKPAGYAINPLEKQFISHESPSSFDVRALSCGFTEMGAAPLDIEKEGKSQIEIQCIETVKSGFVNGKAKNTATNESKIANKSVELTKTEYNKRESATLNVGETSTTTTNSLSAMNGESNVRISRYFEALRVTQENLKKSQMKPTLAKLKKGDRIRQRQKAASTVMRRSSSGAGSSLANVLELLQTKQQK